MTHEGFYLKGELMNNEQYPNTAVADTSPLNAKEAAQPDLVKKIGNTTFDIHVHFSEKSKETFTDKVIRLIQSDTVTSKKVD